MSFDDAVRAARVAYETGRRVSIENGVFDPDSLMSRVILGFLETATADSDVRARAEQLGRLASVESNELEDALLETIVLIRAQAASRAHLIEGEKRLNGLLDATVPISDDRRTVFVDGPGFVDLDYNNERLQRAETAELIVALQREVIERVGGLLTELRARAANGDLDLIELAIPAVAPRILTDELPGGHVLVAFTIERGRPHDNGGMTLDGTVALGRGCSASLTVSVTPELVATSGPLLTQPGKSIILAIEPLRAGSRTAKACAILSFVAGGPEKTE